MNIHISSGFLLICSILILHGVQVGGDKKVSQHKEGTTSDKKGGRVLLLADSKYFSHLAVAVQIANLMHGDGHQVDFVVADYKQPGEALDIIPKDGIRVIRLPVDLEFERIFLKSPAVFSDWTTEVQSSRQAPYWELMNYHTVSIYKAIIENPEVKIDEKEEKLLDWLRLQKYDFGIGQYGHFTSSFAVFHELGLKDTVAYSATPALPAFYHFIGVKIPPKVPEHYSAMPGDGDGTSKIREVGSKRYNKNIEEYEYSIGEFKNIFDVKYKDHIQTTIDYVLEKKGGDKEELEKLKPMPPLSTLLRGVRYFLVNHHPLAAFPRPLNEKIVFFGGTEVEALNLFEKRFDTTDKNAKKTKKTENAALKELFGNIPYSTKVHGEGFSHSKSLIKAKCIVIFSLGTIIKFEKVPEEAIKSLLGAFGEHKNCEFIVRIDEELIVSHKNELPKNVHIVHFQKRIPQKQLMELKKVQAIIHHCGQNSLTESLYAGIPIICVPFFGDQRYNASVVEYMGVGIVVKYMKFAEQFPKALKKLLEKKKMSQNYNDLSYIEKSKKVAVKIHASESQKKIFLKIINEVLNNPSSEPFEQLIETELIDKDMFDAENKPFDTFDMKMKHTGKKSANKSSHN